MNNPGSILKLWSKAVKTHEADKDPKTLPKKGQEQKSKVKQGLTTLKIHGAVDMAAPANAQQFVVVRDKVGRLMTRYCRYLKAAKDEDKKILPKYLKTVTQLTAVVLSLDPGNLSQDEEDPSLENLAGVDVAAVEKALAAPDTGEDIDLEAGTDQAAQLPSKAETRPQDKTDQDKDLYLELMSTLPKDLERLKKLDAAAASRIEPIVTAAAGHAKKGDYKKALTYLNQASTALHKALEGAPGVELAEEDEESPKTNMATWNKAKDKVDAEINRLCDFLRKTQDAAAVKTADNLAAAMDLFKVDLTSSLMNIDQAQGEQKKQLYPKVSKVLENYKKSLLADDLLAAVDDNPFVSVNARKPLLTALHQIQKNLEAQVGG